MAAGFHPKGVYCLEGDWSGDPKHKYSIDPLLTLLDELFTDHASRRHIRYDVATTAELEFHLDKWTQRRFSTHPILYLSFHGEAGVVRLSTGEVTLDWLEEKLRGRCARRIIHFGSCSTLGVHGNRLNRFLRETGALAVSGYEGDVNWIRSAAFELLFLTEFQYGALRATSVKSAEDRVRADSAGLSKQLGWRVWY